MLIWSVSKVYLFEVLESSSLLKGFQLSVAKEFFNVLLYWKFVSFLDLGTKFKPLLRTDFSESESSKFSEMVTTVLRFSGYDSLVIWGPISWSSFWALIWCKCLKSLELASWILARMDCTKTAGQILESSERQYRICSLSLLRFWHIALIVILVILREKEFWAHWIWWRYWLEWEKEDAWKLERKPLGITLEWRQRPMKWMWLQNLVFAKTRTAKRNASSLLIGGKGKKVTYDFLA